MHQVRTSTYGLLDLIPYDARDLRTPLLPGSEAFAAEGDFGLILTQCYRGEFFSITVNFFRLHKKSTVWMPVTGAALQSISCLKGSGQHRMESAKTTLRNGQYFLTAPGNELHEVSVERDKEYSNFIIAYDKLILEPLLPYFPVLATVLEGRSARSSSIRTFWMNKNISILIEQFMHAFFEPTLRNFLFGEWAEDLLHSMLIELGRQPLRLKNLSPADIEKINRARALILENVKRHHQIEELSRKVELNEFKIKEGFRQLFGKGPFALLKDARMQVAYELLLHTNRPEKDIMTEVGYTSLTAFVKAFRSVYGIPPGQLRHNKNNF